MGMIILTLQNCAEVGAHEYSVEDNPLSLAPPPGIGLASSSPVCLL